MTGKRTNRQMVALPSRRRFLVAAGAVALFTVARPVLAAPHVDADPNKTYQITPDVGPYVICAASYTGATAVDLSHQVVLCLRRRDNLPAYVHNWGEERRQQQHEWARQQKEKYGPEYRVRGLVRYDDECVVLIGGYKSMEEATEALKDVKKLKMPEVSLGPNQTVNPIILTPAEGGKGTQLYEVSPFINCFVTHNPTVKIEHAAKKDDPFLKELNSDEEFSLLKCPSEYTLMVRCYAGVSTFQPQTSSSSSFLNNLFSDSGGKVLNAGAAQAHETARVLRSIRPGYDAYVLHTRQASFVTVGGFNGPDDKRLLRVREQMATDRRLLLAGGQMLNPFGLVNYKADSTQTLAQQADTLGQAFFYQLQPMRIPRP